MALYRTGHIPDDPAVVARRLGLHLHPRYSAIRATALPLQTTNRAKLPTSQGGPGLFNQNDTGACEGHAHASGATLFFACLGQPLPEPVSPSGLYLGALKIDRQPNPDGSLPQLFDTGTMPSSIVSAWGLYGACGISAWGQFPASSTTLYAPPVSQDALANSGPLLEPTPEQLASAFPVDFGGAYFIQTLGKQKILQALQTLAAGYPITDAIAASGGAFQQYSSGVLTGTQMTGDIDHANLWVDYTWTGTASQFATWQADPSPNSDLDQYLLGHGVNSWGGEGCPYGGDWGAVDTVNSLGGQYQFDKTWIDVAQTLCVLDLTRTA